MMVGLVAVKVVSLKVFELLELFELRGSLSDD